MRNEKNGGRIAGWCKGLWRRFLDGGYKPEVDEVVLEDLLSELGWWVGGPEKLENIVQGREVGAVTTEHYRSRNSCSPFKSDGAIDIIDYEDGSETIIVTGVGKLDDNPYRRAGIISVVYECNPSRTEIVECLSNGEDIVYRGENADPELLLVYTRRKLGYRVS